MREANLGWAAIIRGDAAAARDRFERALEMGGGSDDFFRAHVLAGLCLVMALLDQPDEAETLGDGAICAARLCPGRQILVMALTRAVEVAISAGRLERADLLLRELLALLRELGARCWVAETLELAALVVAAGNPATAAATFGAAEALRTGLGEPASPTGILVEHIAECRRRIAEEINAEDLQGALRRGRAMAIDDAIACARDGLSLTRWSRP